MDPARSPSRRRRSFPSPAAVAVPILAALLPLGGCKLVDQRSFDPGADRRPVPHYPPAAAPKPVPAPLALVRFDGGDWRPAVGAIVRQALDRKPDALFRVETVVPGNGTPEQQAALLAAASRTQGAAVADTVVAAGASPAQVELTGAADPALRRVEVRVTAR